MDIHPYVRYTLHYDSSSVRGMALYGRLLHHLSMAGYSSLLKALESFHIVVLYERVGEGIGGIDSHKS